MQQHAIVDSLLATSMSFASSFESAEWCSLNLRMTANTQHLDYFNKALCHALNTTIVLKTEHGYLAVHGHAPPNTPRSRLVFQLQHHNRRESNGVHRCEVSRSQCNAMNCVTKQVSSFYTANQ